MASLKDWSEIAASPTYQNASDQQKQDMQAKYQSAGGVIPQAAPVQPPADDSVASSVGNFLADTVKSGANTVSHDVARGIAGLVQMGDRAANKVLGMEPSSLSTYGRRMEQNADDLYKRRQQDIGDTTGRTVGEYGGRIVGDVGAMIAAPEVAIPGIAAREMGNAYANQKDGQESLTDAVNVGAANYLANSLLPGAGSRVADSILGRSMELAGDVGRNAAVGAGGGAVVGAANASNDNPDASLGQVITQSIEDAGTGAAFGGAFGGASRLLSRGGRASKDVLDSTPDTSKANIDSEAQNISDAKNSTDLLNAYANGGQYNAVRGSQILADQGVPLLDSRLYNDPAGQAAFGKTQEDAFKSMDAGRDSATNARLPFVTRDGDTGRMAVTKNAIEDKGSTIVKNVEDSLNNAKQSTDDFVKDLNAKYASESDKTSFGSQIRAETAGIHRFQQNLNDYVTLMKRDKGSSDPARQQSLLNKAKQVQDSFDSTPDYFQDHFNSNYRAPTGFTEGFNPIAHAAEYNSVYNQLDNMHGNFRNGNTNPTAGRNATVGSGSFIDKVVGTTVDALKSGSARRGLRTEQERNLAQVQNLARGDLATRQSRTAVDDARTSMEETPAVDTTPDMEYSQPEVAPTSPEAEVVSPQPDQGLVRTPRRVSEPAPEVTPEPEVQTPREVDQTLVRSPRQPEAPVETPATETTVTPEEVVQPEADQTLVRQPRRSDRSSSEEPIGDYSIPSINDQTSNVRVIRRGNEIHALGLDDGTSSNDLTPLIRSGRTVEESLATLYGDHPQGGTPDATKVSRISNEPVRNTIDQTLVRQPERPAQEVSSEEPAPAPEPVPETRPEVDQTLVRRPETRFTEEPVDQSISEPEAPTETPREDMSPLARADRNIQERKLNSVKDQFSTQAAKDQITVDNMHDKEFLKQVRREDVANNVDALNHSVEQVNRARRIREAKQHKLNMNELENWSKEYNIPWSFVNDAIKAKGLSHSNILGVNDIKVRAEKAYEKYLKPKTDGTVDTTPQGEEVKWSDQRDSFFKEVGGMNNDIQKAVMPMINQAFKASERTGKPLTPSETNSLWKKIYNQEEAINKKLGKKKEADEAALKAKELEDQGKADEDAATKKAEDDAKRAKTNKQIQELHDLSVQLDKVSGDMRKEFGNDSDPKEVQNFIDSYMDRNFGIIRQPLPQGRFEEAYTKARNAAERYNRKLQKDMTPAEVEMELSGSTGPLSESNPELEALHKEIDNLKKQIKGSKVEDVKDAQDALSGEIVDRAEKALRDGDNLDEIADAANVLSKVYYGNDSPAGHSLRQYVRMLQKSKSYQDTYPDQPALWLSSDDVANLAKSNTTHANGLKSQIVRVVLGKNPDDVNLMTNAQREEAAKAVDSGKVTKQIPLNKTGRAALLEADADKPIKSRYKLKARRLNLKKDR